jgi:predicted short-subunit dehydrogenase-like oxidoreductase (DUF2520 family)
MEQQTPQHPRAPRLQVEPEGRVQAHSGWLQEAWPEEQPRSLAVVGRGRLGTALVSALQARDYPVFGPFGRGADGRGFDAVLLCVPDARIAEAAALIEPGRLVGHCSGATGLEVLGRVDAFSVHPLMTITGTARPAFEGAAAAVAGSGPGALAFARRLANILDMEPIEVHDRDRIAYHAAACFASNFLVMLEAAAERLAGTAGVDRRALVPLVRATVENWSELGPERALTGPVARGDHGTVAAHRETVAERAPELLGLFDSLVQATRELADSRERAAA